jgi:pimeloyl-ACP methyl ester carboxylesterase
MISLVDKANLRLIALEHIGYGDSSQWMVNSVADWLPIMREVVEELGMDKAEVIGMSADAPYAYATASALPDIIGTVYILGGVPGVYEERILKHYDENAQKQYKQFLETDMPSLQEYYVSQLKSFLNQLKENNEAPPPPYMVKTIEEDIKQDCFGMALESRLQISPWNIDFFALRQPVKIYHARADEMVPFNAAKEMTRYFKECEFKELKSMGNEVHRESISAAFMEIVTAYVIPPGSNINFEKE